ncbi:unnamed protein product, partial [Oncorhynchus mykiss]
MLPVSRAIMDRDRELQDTMAGVHPNSTGASGAALRGMKRGDPASDAQTSAALVESVGAECKRPRIDASGVVAEVGQNNDPLTLGYHGYPTHSQGSQDAAGGQEGLVPPSFSAFPPPPPPPPQNGLALEYGASLYAAGAIQGSVEAGQAGLNTPTSVPNSLTTHQSDVSSQIDTQLVSTGGVGGGSVGDDSEKGTPKRLHVSNIPFRFRDPDLRQMFGVRDQEYWARHSTLWAIKCQLPYSRVEVESNGWSHVQSRALYSPWFPVPCGGCHSGGDLQGRPPPGSWPAGLRCCQGSPTPASYTYIPRCDVSGRVLRCSRPLCKYTSLLRTFSLILSFPLPPSECVSACAWTKSTELCMCGLCSKLYNLNTLGAHCSKRCTYSAL